MQGSSEVSTAAQPPRAPGPAHQITAGAGFIPAMVALCGVMLLVAALVGALTPTTHRLLLAPMMGLDACLFSDRAIEAARAPAIAAQCAGKDASAAPVIEATLHAFAARQTSGDGRLRMGYTLNLPLLKFLKPAAGGTWALDEGALDRAARTVRDTDRPVVLYFFSTHFASGAPAEAALARDPDNLLQTQQGPLGVDRYLDADIYPWSFVRTDNGITKARERVMTALLGKICALPLAARERIRGVTLLGELHHMFPHFEDGMGFAGPYLITDYSQASARGFRLYLAERFGHDIGRLNQSLGSAFADFSDVPLPAKDIRTQRLSSFWEHIDSSAGGTLPVMGWVYADAALGLKAPWVRIYVDGQQKGRVQAKFGREDVLQARPDVGTANVGWRFDLPFAATSTGMHRIDVLLEDGQGGLLRMGSRVIAVMDRQQSTPQALPTQSAIVAADPPAALAFSLDAPADGASYYFNPLVPLWNDFRAQQVRDYLEHFRRVAAGSCIPADRIYSHQILPFVNPGWDRSKFAVEDDLDVPADVMLGVSLYGEASYGSSFFDWLATTGRAAYGVTEFHPLRAMAPAELGEVFGRHAAHGARFVSFFVDAAGAPPWRAGVSNPMSFDADNPLHGSAQLRRSVQMLMH